MADSTATLRRFGTFSLIAGIVMMLAAAATWFMISAQLKAENIVIPDDAAMFAGKTVNGPIDAFIQANVINDHALAMTENKTYAEIDREDPLRATAMNASFLRASLFTSVVAYGVTLFAFGMGLLWTWLGVGLRKVGVVATT